jgi:hypothetical protein
MTPTLPATAAPDPAALEPAALEPAALEPAALDAAALVAAADVVLLVVLVELEPQAASSSEPAATKPSTAVVFKRMDIPSLMAQPQPIGGAGLPVDHTVDMH